MKTAKDLLSEFEKRSISLDLAGGILCFLLAKSLTTAEVVLLLCRQQYPKDALILVRTIYEAALWALDLFREPAVTAEKAIAFIRPEPADRKEILLRMLALVKQNENRKRNGPDSANVEEESETVAAFLLEKEKFKARLAEELRKAEQHISKIEKEHRVSRSLLNYGKKKVLQLAADAQLLSEHYTFYWQSSLYAHNRPRSSISFMRETEKGWQFCWGPEKKDIDDVLIYLCHFLWYILSEFNSYFKLGRDDDMLQKWQELEELRESAPKEE